MKEDNAKKETVIESEPNPKSELEKLFRVIAIILFIGGILAIIIIKYNKPEWAWSWIWISGFFLILACTTLYFSFKIIDKFSGIKDKNRMNIKPEAVDKALLREIVFNILKDKKYMNMVEYVEKDYIETVGEVDKSSVYVAKVIPTYKRNNEDGKIINHYYIIVNMHFPHKMSTVLMNSQPGEVKRAVQSIGGLNEVKFDIERTTTVNPFTGTTVESSKIQHFDNKDKQKKLEDF